MRFRLWSLSDINAILLHFKTGQSTWRSTRNTREESWESGRRRPKEREESRQGSLDLCCVMDAFPSHLCPPNPDSHQWIFCGATPVRRPFMETFPQTPFFPHTSSRLARATQMRLSSGCPSLEKPMCNGTMRDLDHMLPCGCAFTLNTAAHQNIHQ